MGLAAASFRNELRVDDKRTVLISGKALGRNDRIARYGKLVDEPAFARAYRGYSLPKGPSQFAT